MVFKLVSYLTVIITHIEKVVQIFSHATLKESCARIVFGERSNCCTRTHTFPDRFTFKIRGQLGQNTVRFDRIVSCRVAHSKHNSTRQQQKKLDDPSFSTSRWVLWVASVYKPYAHLARQIRPRASNQLHFNILDAGHEHMFACLDVIVFGWVCAPPRRAAVHWLLATQLKVNHFAGWHQSEMWAECVGNRLPAYQLSCDCPPAHIQCQPSSTRLYYNGTYALEFAYICPPSII